MSEQRFQIGDLVRVQAFSGLAPDAAFRDALTRDGTAGIYVIADILSVTYDRPRYRLKREDGTAERIVREIQLAPAVRRRAP